MKKQNKIYWILGVVVVVLVALILIFANKNEGDSIKIGYISSLSGDAGVWGQALREGFDYGLNEYNLNPDSKYKFEAVYEDDACDPGTGISAFNKVVDFQGVRHVTGTVCSSVSMAVADIVNKNEVFYIASGATNPELIGLGDKIFRLYPVETLDVETSIKYAIEELGLNSFSISYFNDILTGLAIKKSSEEMIDSYGKNVINFVEHSTSETNFSAIATKLMQGNPDAVYVMSLPEAMPIMVNKLKTLGYKGVIFLYGSSAKAKGVQENIVDKSNIYYATQKDVRETSFWDGFKTKTGEEADELIALGYDSFNLIKDAVEKCGKDTDCARDYVLSLKKYQTARGTIGFKENGELADIPYEVVSVK